MAGEKAIQRVAVVGAGPAGFYVADQLLGRGAGAVQVDLLERLPVPFGLLRYGVAPDHQRIKELGSRFEAIAARDGFRFLGNVEVGRDVSVDELLGLYDQVCLTVGCGRDRPLGIPGAEPPLQVGAAEFVAWYNGHPDARQRRFDLGHERVVIVGVGDVASDLIRILLGDTAKLAATDIAPDALESVREGKVREVVLLARRGAGQLKMALEQIRQVAQLPGVTLRVEGADLEGLLADPELDRWARKRVEYLAEVVSREPPVQGEKTVRFLFLRSPVEIRSRDGGAEIVVERNRIARRGDGRLVAEGTGATETLAAGLVLSAVGYRGTPLPGVPFDTRRGIVPNELGRVGVNGEVVPRLYVAGWIKHGPQGLIGTNKADAARTVDALLADSDPGSTGRGSSGDELALLLATRGVRVISWADWLVLDRAEREGGAARGKVREKIVSIDQALEVLASASALDG